MAERANSQSGTVGSKETLENKVAMLFDGSKEDDRSLAVSLASHGADIAIVCRESHANHARETKRLVEAEGRRCLIVPLRGGRDLSRELILQTTSMLGRLDIFIDSSLPSTEANVSTGA